MRMLPLFFLLACPAPNDPAGEEVEDTESEPVDSDGDGLLDDDEIAIGSNPEETDSDGDGWLDGDEVDLGTSPIWEYSHPFDKGEYSVGSCPVRPDEAVAGANGTGSYGNTAYQEGDVLKNFTNVDSYGQEITPYAFCGNYTLLTLSAIWCSPCQQLASQMPGDMEEIRAVYPNFGFYELLFEDAQGNLPNEDDLSAWRREFELTGIPVVAPQSSAALYVGTLNATGSIPSTLLLAPDMTIIWSAVDNPRDYYLASPDQILTAIEDYEASL